MLWWEFCTLTQKPDEPNFLEEFGFDRSRSIHETALAMSYFMFTSLSTVGLGDFHPINSYERILGAIILLFGVLITSIVIENLATMMKKLQALERDYEESS